MTRRLFAASAVALVGATALAQQPAPSAAVSEIDAARAAYRNRRFAEAEKAVADAIDALRADRARQFAALSAGPPPAMPRVGIDVPELKKTRDALPRYSAKALEASALGFVVVEAVIDRQGQVKQPKVVRSVPHLDAAAVDAIKQWRFAPALESGKPIEVSALLAANFTFRTDPQIVDDLDFAAFYHSQERFQMAAAALARALGTIRRESSTCLGTRVNAGRARAAGGVTQAPAPGAITEPVKMKDVHPVYPVVLHQARRSALVVLDAVIDRDGNVGCLHVVRGDPFFDQSAIDAVRQWRYEPTRLDGVPVPVIMTVTVNYSIR